MESRKRTTQPTNHSRPSKPHVEDKEVCEVEPNNLMALLDEIRALMAAKKPVYTIEEFCEAHEITKPFYHKLRKLGLGPREMVVGRRKYVTQEAAAEWRRDREKDQNIQAQGCV